MKKVYILFALLLVCTLSFAQSTEDYAVELTAATQTAPPQITLKWKLLTVDTPSYYIWKKAKTATSWGSPIAILTASDSTYTDAAVIVDSAYEYQVWAEGTVLTSSGYIYAGIKSPAMHNKGILLLLVDSTFTDSCTAALKIMMHDLWADGWQLIRHDFPRTAADTTIKAVIANDYATHTNVKAIQIVGHLAVPYSADFNAAGYYPPDGHVPDHDGAWPSDIFYSCLAGPWTDVTVSNSLGYFSPNWNTPGDGKWDQTIIPSPAVLQVSRIDFNNMPSFSGSEAQLMNSYLAKDHTYKMDSLAVRHRALISDNFGPFSGEAFAANGFRNFPPLVGRDSVASLPFISTLSASSYQWAYGCGGGTFTSAGGIGSSSDFVTNPVNAIFTMLFGSFFGDWNVQDNFLRAPLCANPPALTNCWAGRPNWYFHHMALGENIGYSALLAQNNGGSLYEPAGYGAGYVHVALMGDLSLRTDYIKPPSNLVITTPPHNGAVLTWAASPDPGVIGYYVYRADSLYGFFKRLNTPMLTALTYHDDTGIDGSKYYEVRPVTLQPTPSGGYYNLGIGITDTPMNVTYPHPALQVADLAPSVSVLLFPNPAQNYLKVTVNAPLSCEAVMFVVNEQGQSFDLITKQLGAGENNYSLNVASLAPGIYSLVVKTGNSSVVRKWVKL
jgi:type IX secretion system substrate protein